MGYIGGKSKISKFIIPKIPTDIEIYSEPFLGMGWNYLKMDLKKYPNLKTVVLNDLNQLNTNLFRCAKEARRMLDTVEYYPFQKFGEYPTPPEYEQRYKKYQIEIFDPHLKIGSEPDFDIAWKYAYVLSNGWSGNNPQKTNFIDLKGKYRCKMTSFINKLKNGTFKENLDRITIVENMDFQDVIRKYDSLGTFFYCDPPYANYGHLYAGNHKFFGIEEHLRLSGSLDNILGRFALSYYRYPELDNLYSPDFFTYYEQNFKKGGSARKGIEQDIATELLITNY